MKKLVGDLNRLYRSRPALHARDFQRPRASADRRRCPELGVRVAAQGARQRSDRRHHQFHARRAGELSRGYPCQWREMAPRIINTDAEGWRRIGAGDPGLVVAAKDGGGDAAATVWLLPLATIMLEFVSE